MGDETCPFCDHRELALASNQHAFAISGKSPIAAGHSVIVARPHVPTIFKLSTPEYVALL